jgi:superfamily II DNA or RNA helicase
LIQYLGEGFDDARLDTLFLALPVSWRGTLSQYAGRLHRLHDMKKEVVIYDYVDPEVPVLGKMYKRRLAGYKAIGYEIKEWS